ncbi:MAG: DEAD/DEAH box helicase, partial [Treponema sp.]|nr:DEAD/DEAH box helicase [Treponema sp.]
MNFTEFNLNEQLQNGISAAGYTTCTPVQEQVLKISQDGSDLYVQSQTGTGKTAAYLVAIIQEMLTKSVG